MCVVVDELRFAIRMLWRRKLLAAVAILTLGLGIGLTATMFSALNGVVLRGLSLEAPDRLRYVERAFAPERDEGPALPTADFLEIGRAQRSFEDLAAFRLGTVNVSGTGVRPQRYGGAFVTANLFDVLRASPRLGRPFLRGEDQPGAAPAAIVSDRVWRDHFAGASAIGGETLRANGVTYAVVGVMPAGFGYPVNEDIWIPLGLDPGAGPDGGVAVEVVGRLRDGTPPSEAQAEMSGLAAHLAEAFPERNRDVGLALRTHLGRFLGDGVVRVFVSGLLAVVAVLLIASTNVTNLLLALASVRARELAIRAAFGATRLRVLGQLMAEAFALAVAGGLLGLGLARIGVSWFTGAIAETNPPYWVDVRLDAGEVLFVAGLVAVVTVIAGAAPVVRASGARAGEILKDEVRGSTGGRLGRISRVLVIVEVAASFGLLLAAGLMVRTVLTVNATDFGFSPDDVLTGSVTLPPTSYPDPARQQRFWDSLVDRLERYPGVRAAALTSSLPGTGTGRTSIGVDGVTYDSPGAYPRVRSLVIGPRFFETFGLQMLEGREFAPGETSRSGAVAIVNRRVVDGLYGGESPVGRRLQIVAGNAAPMPATVIGVAPAIGLGGVHDLDTDAVYLPLAQHPQPTMTVAMRTFGDPGALAPALRDVVTVLDPDLPVYALQDMTRALHLTTWFYGVFGTVFMVFGGVALVMVAAGLYGLMTFSVARRTREIGVRMAMGARPADVLRLVFGQAAGQLGAGLLAGIVLAAWLARLLGVLLVGVQPWDPGVVAVVVVSLVATGLVACLGPALRAARIAPIDALRHD
ncbi:MAG: ABC transporter permease [Verrucomicrobiota bacterium]